MPKPLYFGYLFILYLFVSISCKPPQALLHTLPSPVDTRTRPITLQERRNYVIQDVSVDNQFDGARLNNFEAVDNSTYRVTISPENFPINSSAYYAFRISSPESQTVTIELHYTEHDHRYIPKTSYDAQTWTHFSAEDIDTTLGNDRVRFNIQIGPDTLWVAGQEIMNSTHARDWVNSMSTKSHTSNGIVGKSTLGRDLLWFDINEGLAQEKEAIVIISRQHPPEVTGYMAMMWFVEQISKDNVLSNAFRKKYRVLVYPMLNPDGVDEGHWRHNAGGVDLNRDWAVYNQTEIEQIANHIVTTTAQGKNKVILGLDFHSTQKDIYYTLSDELKSSIYPFKDIWIYGIDQSFDEYEPNDAPSGLTRPISKAWFYLQFGAEGVTYEIGDETPRKFIKAKAEAAAEEMMKLLILRE